MSNYKKGMELIIKGDGSVFDHSIKDTATTSEGCIAVFCEQHFYAVLSGLRSLVFQPYTAVAVRLRQHTALRGIPIRQRQ